MTAPDPAPNAPARQRRGGLFRRLLFPIVGVSLLTALGAGGLVTWLRVAETRSQLRDSLQGNVSLIERLRLPVSDQLITNLAEATGLPVAAKDAQGRWYWGAEWTPAERALARESLTVPEGLASTSGGEALALPISQGRGHLLILNRRTYGAVIGDPRLWLVVGSSLFLGAWVAMALSKRLVMPMGQLAARAPNLDYTELPKSLTRRSDELGTLALALQEASRKARDEREKRKQSERLALLGRITMSLAHEIRNPAAAILAQTEQATSEASSLIRSEAEEILSLVNQWLFIARPSPAKNERVDLGALLQDLSTRLTPLADFRHCRIELDLTSGLIVSGDRARLGQCFRNLISNAIAAMPGGGSVRISARKTERAIELSVADEGPGFSVEALERAGEAFFSEKEGGMGLGLTLVKTVIESHGGAVSFDNQGDGAKVGISLPHPKTSL